MCVGERRSFCKVHCCRHQTSEYSPQLPAPSIALDNNFLELNRSQEVEKMSGKNWSQLLKMISHFLNQTKLSERRDALDGAMFGVGVNV